MLPAPCTSSMVLMNITNSANFATNNIVRRLSVFINSPNNEIDTLPPKAMYLYQIKHCSCAYISIYFTFDSIKSQINIPIVWGII